MADSKAANSVDAVGGDRLPFEPGKGRKKKAKAPAASSGPMTQPDRSSQSAQSPRRKPTKTPTRTPTKTLEETRIPDIVGKRMLRRMALFSGVPSVLGISTFFVAYYLLTHEILEFPNSFVFAVSMLFFGLSVVGLSYGVLSASWEEDLEGSWLGAREFSLNFGRMRQAWREAREINKAGQ